ncbi:MAG: histidine kinase [Pseudomonadota bacterium]
MKLGRPATTEAVSTAQRAARFLRTGVYCVAVAALLAYLGISDFSAALLVSFCVGFSITAAFTLLQTRLEQMLGPWLSAASLIVVGVVSGLMISGALRYGDPLILIVANPGTLLLCLALGIGGYLVVGTRGRLLQSRVRIAELERTQAQQAQQLAENQLKLLQAQIEPHFLFNTLGNIQGLIDSDPATAQHLVEKLTALLRRSLTQTRTKLISLRQESELVRDYLAIQVIRMGGRLTFEIELAPDVEGLSIPPLLLQPLVENAITHGIEPRKGPGHVSVIARRDRGSLQLRVVDNGVGLTPTGSPASGTGTALANIRARLQALYDGDATLRLLENPPAGVCAELRLPVDLPENS